MAAAGGAGGAVSRRGVALAALAALVAALATATALAWGGDAGAPAPAPAPAAPGGASLLAARGCIGCHMAPGHDQGVQVGPDLRQLPGVAASRRPGVAARDYVRESILAPGAYVVPGYAAMPPVDVTPAEARALAGLLLGLSAPTG